MLKFKKAAFSIPNLQRGSWNAVLFQLGKRQKPSFLPAQPTPEAWYQKDDEFCRSAGLVRFPRSQNQHIVKQFCDGPYSGVHNTTCCTHTFLVVLCHRHSAHFVYIVRMCILAQVRCHMCLAQNTHSTCFTHRRCCILLVTSVSTSLLLRPLHLQCHFRDLCRRVQVRDVLLRLLVLSLALWPT